MTHGLTADHTMFEQQISYHQTALALKTILDAEEIEHVIFADIQ